MHGDVLWRALAVLRLSTSGEVPQPGVYRAVSMNSFTV